MKLKTRIAAMAIALVLSIGFIPVPAHAAANITVLVDGNAVAWTDAQPYIDNNGRTMVPLRAAAEAMGLDIEWDNDTKTALFSESYSELGQCPYAYWTDEQEYPYLAIAHFAQNSNMYTVELIGLGDAVTEIMDTAVVNNGGRLYAPIRYLAEAFGYYVRWYAPTKTVVIEKLPDYSEYAVTIDSVRVEVPDMTEETLIPVFEEYFVRQNATTVTISAPKETYVDPKVTTNYFSLTSKATNFSIKGAISLGSTGYFTDETIERTVYDATKKAVGDKYGIYKAWALADAETLYRSLLHTGELHDGMSEYERARVMYYALCPLGEFANYDKLCRCMWSVFHRGGGNCAAWTQAYNRLLELDGITCWRQTDVEQTHSWTVALLDGKLIYVDAVGGDEWAFDCKEEWLRSYLNYTLYTPGYTPGS